MNEFEKIRQEIEEIKRIAGVCRLAEEQGKKDQEEEEMEWKRNLYST